MDGTQYDPDLDALLADMIEAAELHEQAEMQLRRLEHQTRRIAEQQRRWQFAADMRYMRFTHLRMMAAAKEARQQDGQQCGCDQL